MLKQKRARDLSLPRDKYYHKQIFARYKCIRDGYENIKGACYFIKSTSAHYKLNGGDIDKWAQLVGVNKITLQMPP
jgi:hypothetical protein